MPSFDDVLPQVRDVVVAVVECDPVDVTPDAQLSRLGVDSLALVEIADEAGRRAGRFIADDAVDRLVTVSDVVDAVLAARQTSHRGGEPTRRDEHVVTELHAPPAPSQDALVRLALWFVAIGVVVGLFFGLGGSAAINALGLGDVNLPPVAQPTSVAPTPTPSATPTPTPTVDEESTEPSFVIEQGQVSPGERFTIRGRFPDLPPDDVLEVQVRDAGATEWDSFAGVTIRTSEGGNFQTRIYTSRTGEREFRVRVQQSGDLSPTAKVQIG